MNDLTNSERETHLNLVADDRGTWHCFTDDPVMIRRLDKIATATEVTTTGKHYELDKSQVTLRKKRTLTDEQREKLRERALRLRKHGNSRSFEAQN